MLVSGNASGSRDRFETETGRNSSFACFFGLWLLPVSELDDARIAGGSDVLLIWVTDAEKGGKRY